MKLDNVKVIQYGCGLMSRVIMKNLIEHGADIVGAIDRDPEIVGKDIGEIADLGYMTGLLVSDDAEEVLTSTDADIVILTTMSYMKEVYPSIVQCVENGMNVLTLADEGIYPWNTSTAETSAISRLAKENNVTVTGSGLQDIYWIGMPAMAAAGMNRVDHIQGTISYNVEDYGVEGIDFSASDQSFIEARDSGAYCWNSGYNTSEAIAAHLQLTISSISQKTVPIVLEEDMVSKVKGKKFKAGETVGMNLYTNIETQEGVTIEVQNIAKIFGPDEHDLSDWTIKGDPTTEFSIKKPNTVGLTCGTIVNRIPDVINAKPGYVTVDKLDAPKFRRHPLNLYIE